MFNKLTPLTFLVFIIVFSLSGRSHQTLEKIAPESAENMRRFVGNMVATNSAFFNLTGHQAVIIPPSIFESRDDVFFKEEFFQKLARLRYGQDLLRSVLANGKKIDLRIFHDIPIENGLVDDIRPMWINDQLVRHELMGAFHSDGQWAVVALNNFQSKDVAVYTYAHELFHLVDGNPPANEFDGFVAEYRAILVEANIYLQSKIENQNSRAISKDVFMESDWHETLLDKPYLFGAFGKNQVNAEKVFDATLDLLYPQKPTFRILRVSTLQSRNLVEEKINTYEIVIRALTQIFSDDKSFLPSVIAFTSNAEDLEELRLKNSKARSLIHNYYIENKKLFEFEAINNFNPSKFNNAYQGHGGPRPRGPGG